MESFQSGASGGADGGRGPSGQTSSNSPSSQPQYFCHQCNVQIPNVQSDFSCPTCGGGFIEEVPADSHRHGGSHSSRQFDSNDIQDGIRQFLQGFGLVPPMPSGPGGRAPGQGQTRSGPSGGRSFTVHMSSGNGNPVEVNLNTNAHSPVDAILNSFLNDLVVGLGGGRVNPGAVPFLGNFGDYVWGRDGLDGIVTQLMNQMEGGAPPLATEKLDTLPTVRIQQCQVDKKLQCSVCWDDFKLDEEVKQLDCEHVFHDPCILPWLKLHGTCPICRRDFTDGTSTSESNMETAEPSTTGLNGPHTPAHPPQPQGNNPQRQNPNPGSTTSSSSSSNSIFGGGPIGDFLNFALGGGSRAAPVPNISQNPNTGGSSGTRPSGSGGSSGGGGNINMDMEFD